MGALNFAASTRGIAASLRNNTPSFAGSFVIYTTFELVRANLATAKVAETTGAVNDAMLSPLGS
jgi:hypothetical protein